MKKAKNKLFIILQENKITKEILIFGEIKIKFPDSFEVVRSLNYKNLYHKYYLEEKTYFKNNEKIIIEDITRG